MKMFLTSVVNMFDEALSLEQPIRLLDVTFSGFFLGLLAYFLNLSLGCSSLVTLIIIIVSSVPLLWVITLTRTALSTSSDAERGLAPRTRLFSLPPRKSLTLRRMKLERKKIQMQREDVLSPEERMPLLQDAKNRLTRNIKHLEDACSFETELFIQNLASWLGRITGKPPTRPIAIPRDTQDAKIYRWWAWAGIAIEGGLGSWVVNIIWGLHWVIGALISLLTGFFAYAIILAAIQRSKASRTKVRKIKRFVFWPSVAIFIPSFGIFLASRLLTGAILIVLLPVFEIALWATTLSLLTLVGSLFALSYLIDWSARDEAEYIALEDEMAETTILLAAINAELEEGKTPANDSSDNLPSSNPGISEDDYGAQG